MEKKQMVVQENEKQLRVLLIEDKVSYSRLMKETLTDAEFNCSLDTASYLFLGIEKAKAGNIDIILLDLSLPDSHGIETFLHLQNEVPSIPIIVLTASHDDDLALEAVRLGAQDYVVKGFFDSSLLVHSMRYSIERKRTAEEIQRLNIELEKRVWELEDALTKLKNERAKVLYLQTLLTMCPLCGKIRNYEGKWKVPDEGLFDGTDSKFNQTICDECLEKGKS